MPNVSSVKMLCQRFMILFCVLLLFIGFASSSDENDDVTKTTATTTTNTNNDNGSRGCVCDSVYFAPSTIPNAGWGVFAAKDYKVGEIIGPPSIAIPFLNVHPDNIIMITYNTSVYGVLQEYLWEPADMGGYGEGPGTKLFIPGMSLINHHPTLDNVIPTGLKQDRTSEDNDTRMVGSYTQYHHLQLMVDMDIKAGEELFLNYEGVSKTSQQPLLPSPILFPWLYGKEDNSNLLSVKEDDVDTILHDNVGNELEETDDDDIEDYEEEDDEKEDDEDVDTDANKDTLTSTKTSINKVVVGRKQDYEDTDKMVKALWELHLQNVNNERPFTDVQWMDILYRIRKEELMIHPRGHVIASLFPRTFKELELAYKDGVAKSRLLLKNAIPPSKITKQFCLDNILEGEIPALSLQTNQNKVPSTAPASAAQSIAAAAEEEASALLPSYGPVVSKVFMKGEVITISPLVFIADRDLAMSLSGPSDTTTISNNTIQLLENYCFSHRHTKMMLCPTTNAAMIRHSSNKKQVNVRVQWATSHSWPWSDMTDILAVKNLRMLNADESDVNSFQSTTKLAFEYVALRDIQPGEVLYMDFGFDFQQSMEQHKKTSESMAVTWTNTKKVRNKRIQKEDIILSSDPRMSDFEYQCELYPNIKIDTRKEYRGWEEFNSSQAMDHDKWPEDLQMMWGSNGFASWYPCRVVDVSEVPFYKVEIYSKGYAGRTLIRRLLNCPKERIKIIVAPSQSDQRLPWAFRHFVPVPDDVFPLHWREDYKPSSFWNLGKSADSEIPIVFEQKLRQVKCGLYLANSNIVGAGFGIYTAVDIPSANTVIGSNLPAIINNWPRMKLSNDTFDKNDWVGHDYVWNGPTFDMAYDGYPDLDVDVLNTLFGQLCNFHTGLVNSEIHPGRITPLLDRRKDPGAGAFSDWGNSAFKSTTAVDAGEELFVSYGEHWIRARPHMKDVPLHENFVEVDRVVGGLYSMLSMEGASFDTHIIPDLIQTIQNSFVGKHRTKMALNSIQREKDFRRVIERRGTAKATVKARSQEWFDKNGMCIDHLYVKRSTIPQAGVGAFTRRHLKEGSLVISSPVIAASRYVMEMNYTKVPINSKRLMMNYHFGHKNSSILFFPLTQMLSINHQSTHKPGETGPNAFVRFSLDHSKTKYLLERPIEDIYAETHSCLVMEVVALRDIEPDEEIFIDYGFDWEEAWDTHVKNWKSPCKSMFSSNCFESSQLIVKHMWYDHRHNNKYHEWSSVHMTACKTNLTFPFSESEFKFHLINPKDNTTYDDPSIREEYLGFTYDHEGFDYPYLSMATPRACRILASDVDNDTFDVVYFLHPFQIPGTYKNPLVPNARALIRYKHLPAVDFRFINKPLTYDWHDVNAFRHEIHIPDESFPPLWKDLA